MSIFDATAVCIGIISCVFLLIPVKEMKNTYSNIAAVALSAIVTAYTLKGAKPIFEYLNTFSDSSLSIYFKVLIKVLGITVICNFTSETVSELGFNSLASKVEFAGKVGIMLSSMPIFDALLSGVRGLL